MTDKNRNINKKMMFNFLFGFVLVGIASGGAVLTAFSLLSTIFPVLEKFLEPLKYIMFPIMSYYWGAIYYDSFSKDNSEQSTEQNTSTQKSFAKVLGNINAFLVNSFGMMFTGLGFTKIMPVGKLIKYAVALVFWVAGLTSALKLTAQAIMEFYAGKDKNWKTFLTRLKTVPKDYQSTVDFLKSFSAIIFGFSVACLNFVANLTSWEILLSPSKLLHFHEVEAMILSGNYGLGHLAFASIGGIVTFLAVVPLLHNFLKENNEKASNDKKDEHKRTDTRNGESIFQNVTRYLSSIVNAIVIGVFVGSPASPLIAIGMPFELQAIITALSLPSVYYYTVYGLFQMDYKKFHTPIYDGKAIITELYSKLSNLINSPANYILGKYNSLDEFMLDNYKLSIAGTVELAAITVTAALTVCLHSVISLIFGTALIYDRIKASEESEAAAPNQKGLNNDTSIRSLINRVIQFIFPEKTRVALAMKSNGETVPKYIVQDKGDASTSFWINRIKQFIRPHTVKNGKRPLDPETINPLPFFSKNILGKLPEVPAIIFDNTLTNSTSAAIKGIFAPS